MNETEELKRLLQTGLGNVDREFDCIRKEVVKVHEQFNKVTTRMDANDENLSKLAEEVLSSLEKIKCQLRR
ncbi:hypothetical protein [Peribacillus frigoritolerans]|uniref:Uncharacterized protein n=1 Tax=Peribacillus castrilensis TaxID=2897690 RepID=A0AAW9NFY4_9BACI|nr:hypothetical protein [Peribacillus castrilensis]